MNETPSSGATRLGVELEAAAVRALRAEYHGLSHTFFRGKLRAPALELVDSEAHLGRWVGDTRTLQMNRRLLLDHGWGVVVEVLKHEMAHQYVDEVLGCRAETAHGPAFQQVCAERGIDARSRGIPVDASQGDEEARVLERVSKLLALAQSPNVHEAEAAMSAAQKLMLKYNLDAVSAGREKRYVYRHLGEPSGRVQEPQRILAVILSEHFFVEIIWVPVWRVAEGKRGSVLEVCGSHENVEIADYVHAFLSETAVRLWRDYKRDQQLRGDAERRTFLSGVMSGFRAKLDAEKRRSKTEGLVWVGDAEAHDYLRLRHPHVRTVHYGGAPRSETFAHGKQAGASIVLHRGVKQGPSGGVRLLGGKR